MKLKIESKSAPCAWAFFIFLFFVTLIDRQVVGEETHEPQLNLQKVHGVEAGEIMELTLEQITRDFNNAVSQHLLCKTSLARNYPQVKGVILSQHRSTCVSMTHGSN
uniref:Uncharacterized protein n=1 Tax=Setaria viridis TaxID=4556 RepID=A0A4U6SP65_SETVI|nr:hypothetical protein SEVIR_9G012900v2 [Setaria viridis]